MQGLPLRAGNASIRNRHCVCYVSSGSDDVDGHGGDDCDDCDAHSHDHDDGDDGDGAYDGPLRRAPCVP
jgi:hypothetical protein